MVIAANPVNQFSAWPADNWGNQRRIHNVISSRPNDGRVHGEFQRPAVDYPIFGAGRASYLVRTAPPGVLFSAAGFFHDSLQPGLRRVRNILDGGGMEKRSAVVFCFVRGAIYSNRASSNVRAIFLGFAQPGRDRLWAD